jgi:hypothetical protein
MSCFFDAIFCRLNPEWRKKVGGRAACLPRFFSQNNRETPDVLCNNIALSVQQRRENKTHIAEMANHNVNSGYLTSFYEPYFYLCCELFDVSIQFKYQGNLASFKKKGCSSGKVWSFNASSSHIS